MSKKTVAFKMPLKIGEPHLAAENWVAHRDGSATTLVAPIAPEPIPMKRFTIDVGEGLHKRIKAQCAMRGAKMADIIRELLEREFPE